MPYVFITNNVPRFPVWQYELTARERRDLGLPDTDDCPTNTDGCSGGNGCPDSDGDRFTEYVRYRGSVIPLNDFSSDWGITRGTGLPSPFAGWDGYLSDSYSSGLVIRYVREGDRIDTDRVVIGRFYVTEGE